MTEVGILTLLFLLSFAANTFITLWSAKKVLGIKVSLLQSGFIVLGRFFAALLAGFAVGYAIRLSLQGEVVHKSIQAIGIAIIALLSFLAYWVLLGKATGKLISLWGMTKTVAVETVILLATALGMVSVFSLIYYLF